MNLNRKILAGLTTMVMVISASGNAYGGDILYGDTDSDGVLTASDASKVMQYVLNRNSVDMSEEQFKCAMVSGNDVLSANDAAQIMQKVLNSSYLFPVEKTNNTEETTEVSTEVTNETTTEVITESSTESTTTEDNILSVGSNIFYIGQNTSDMAVPQRVDINCGGYDRYIYNSDYTNYVQAAVKNGMVEAIYIISDEFSYRDISHGDTVLGTTGDSVLYSGENESVIGYYDIYNGNKLYGIMIKSNGFHENYKWNENTYSMICSQVFDITNAIRVQNDIKPLTWSDIAAKTARLHCDDMLNTGYFSHINDNGQRVGERLKAQGITWNYCSENIAAGYYSAMDVMNTWMSSEGHRKNILSPEPEYLGVGFAYNQEDSEQYYTRFTQNFYR